MNTLNAFVFGPEFDPAQQIKAQDEGWKRFARAAGDFLNVTFPGHPTEVHELAQALISLMCAGTEQQLKALEAQAESMKQNMYRFGIPPSLEDNLISLIESRDKVSGQIEAVREGMKEMPEKVQGMMQATAIDPLQDQLKTIEDSISRTQAALEAAAGVIAEGSGNI
jgi:hypothetical protein